MKDRKEGIALVRAEIKRLEGVIDDYEAEALATKYHPYQERTRKSARLRRASADLIDILRQFQKVPAIYEAMK